MHVESQSEVGVPVHIDRVIPEHVDGVTIRMRCGDEREGDSNPM